MGSTGITVTSSSEPLNYDLISYLPLYKICLFFQTQRLLLWNGDLFCRLLRQIVARRQAYNAVYSKKKDMVTAPPPSKIDIPHGQTLLDEVEEVIELPPFDAVVYNQQVDPNTIELDPQVEQELRDLLAAFADTYHNNPFHNFERKS